MRFPYRGAGIGLVKDGFILMGKREGRPFDGLWSVPGGGFEKGLDRDDLSNAEREFMEETGLDLHSLDARPICSWSLVVPFFRWTTFYFHVTDLDLGDARPSEFSELAWVGIDEILGRGQEGIKKHFRPFTRSEVRSLARRLRPSSGRRARCS